MKAALKLSAATWLLTQLTPAFAQDVYELDDITLYSNSVPTELAKTGTTTEVITEDEIKEAPQSRVSDKLAELPGVSASANGGVGSATVLRIRGLGLGYVPVYFDGIDISDPASTGNGFDWGGVTAGGLSRIEVLKGSQSARYGINAVGGVVNMTSFRPTADGFSGQSSVEFGSYGTKNAALGLGFQDDRTEVAFSLSRIETDGFSAASAGTEADGYERTQASLFAAYNLTDTARVGVNLLYIDTAGEFDDYSFVLGIPVDGPAPYDETNNSTTFGVRVFAEFETDAVSHVVAFSHFDVDRLSSSNGFTSPFNGSRSKAEYKASFSTSDTMQWTLGLDHVREKAGAASATVNSVFGELNFAPTDRLDITASLRYDDHDAFGGKATGRVAAAYQLSDSMILRAQAATGYKPPTLFQLTSAYGLPTFTPETNTTLELGLEKQIGEKGFIKATAFHNDLTNQVTWDSTLTYCRPAFPGDLGSGCYKQSDYKSQGIELSGAYAFNDVWQLSGAYTYTDAQTAAGRAGRVPRHDLNLGVQGDFANGWSTGFGVNFVADRVDRDGAAVRMPDYTTVNANIGYKINDKTEVYLRVENVFDEDYETAAGFATSGRAAYFGVRASF